MSMIYEYCSVFFSACSWTPPWLNLYLKFFFQLFYSIFVSWNEQTAAIYIGLYDASHCETYQILKTILKTESHWQENFLTMLMMQHALKLFHLMTTRFRWKTLVNRLPRSAAFTTLMLSTSRCLILSHPLSLFCRCLSSILLPYRFYLIFPTYHLSTCIPRHTSNLIRRHLCNYFSFHPLFFQSKTYLSSEISFIAFPAHCHFESISMHTSCSLPTRTANKKCSQIFCNINFRSAHIHIHIHLFVFSITNFINR